MAFNAPYTFCKPWTTKAIFDETGGWTRYVTVTLVQEKALKNNLLIFPIPDKRDILKKYNVKTADYKIIEPIGELFGEFYTTIKQILLG